MSNPRGVQHNDPRAAALMALAMAIFGTIGIFRRMIPLSSAWVAFFRGAIGSLFLILFMLASRKSGRRKEHSAADTFKLVITGALIGVNWALLFEAYNLTSVSIATLCYYMQPTFVIIMSCIFLRERLTLVKAVCAVTSLTGMVLISGVIAPGQDGGLSFSGFFTGSGLSGEALGIILALAAGGMYATEVILNKTITGFDPYHKTAIQLVSATVVLIPFLILRDGAPDVKWDITLIALLITVGVIHTGLCYTIYFGTMEKLKTHTIALFSYIDPLTALVLSNVILHEELTFLGIFGGVLILGSAIISGLKE